MEKTNAVVVNQVNEYNEKYQEFRSKLHAKYGSFENRSEQENYYRDILDIVEEMEKTMKVEVTPSGKQTAYFSLD